MFRSPTSPTTSEKSATPMKPASNLARSDISPPYTRFSCFCPVPGSLDAPSLPIPDTLGLYPDRRLDGFHQDAHAGGFVETAVPGEFPGRFDILLFPMGSDENYGNESLLEYPMRRFHAV